MKTQAWVLLALALGVSEGRGVAEPPQGQDGGVDSVAVAEGTRVIFSDIELGLAQGNPAVFSDHLASQLYVSIPGEQGAYYSSSQAFYLLEEFLQRTRLPDFRFATMEDGPGTPFASGAVSGTRGRAQVYVSLSWAGQRWVISKISIY